jgi:4-carboxymuconolactone decarboxylase
MPEGADKISVLIRCRRSCAQGHPGRGVASTKYGRTMKKTANERRALGKKVFDDVYGGVVPLPPNSDSVGFLQVLLDQSFAEIWSRDVLSIRDRRLIVIGILAALGEDSPFVIQMKTALLKNELTADQVREIPVFLSHYVGFPRASRMFQAVAVAGLPV